MANLTLTLLLTSQVDPAVSSSSELQEVGIPMGLALQLSTQEVRDSLQQP